MWTWYQLKRQDNRQEEIDKLNKVTLENPNRLLIGHIIINSLKNNLLILQEKVKEIDRQVNNIFLTDDNGLAFISCKHSLKHPQLFW